MYCKECGNKVNDGDNFCNKCGNKISLIEKKGNLSSKNISKEYNFTKVKQLGALNLLVIKTKVNIDEEIILIEENKYYLGFIKRKSKNRNLKLSEINNLTNKKSMDVIDGIYAIIFTLISLALLNPAFLIGTAVCLWTGYGEKIFMYTSKNEKIAIQTQGGNSSKELINLLK
ncbi:hypothetical protein LF65_00092 [Clostridium beijerinckii]|uniref:Zinc-ribbon domain-containing protein n=1 Tax=Clostridium beijerinckii TaxID=1520 RepID=A0A0B5QJD9_CLOBE|nr:zinc ribbon domain-containing protein [Clostridium beijerinckii]AJG96783.1 hypothetical protein LF65_00092 [Clostridium beijerinckii]